MSFTLVNACQTDLKVARYYQNLYNHGKQIDKKNENIGRVANFLEEFMEQVPDTFLDYKTVEKILLEDLFHDFVRTKSELIYKETMEKYGHLISNPKYHPEHGTTDFSNPDMLFDEYLINDTDL